MGKAQSKRSVDITTEGKKGPEEEVTGKLEMIEDIDQKQVNGDATPQENNDSTEKKDADESENDKDLTTEKSAEAGGDAGDQSNSTAGESSSPKEDTAEGAAAKDGAAVEEISPLAEESTKKSKKEKLKKKWSFRSISFGKKDKQKPAKTEETAENSPATNGDAEKATVEEGDADASKKVEGAAGDAEAKSLDEAVENGVATEKELSGSKTPTSTPTEEEKKQSDFAANGSDTAATTTAAAAIAELSSVRNNGTANECETEDKVAADPAVVESTPLSNGADTEVGAEKNGSEMPTQVDEVVKVAAAAVEAGALAAINAEMAVDKVKTIASLVKDGCGGEKPHQNGTSDDAEADGGVEQFKSQNEVIHNTITNYDNTQKEESLATTFTISSTSTYSDRKSYPNDPPEQSNANPNLNVKEQTDDLHERRDTESTKEDEAACQVVSCETQPPPLPVSPPPSQVSVFAFNADKNSESNEANVAFVAPSNVGLDLIETKAAFVEVDEVAVVIVAGVSEADADQQLAANDGIKQESVAASTCVKGTTDIAIDVLGQQMQIAQKKEDEGRQEGVELITDVAIAVEQTNNELNEVDNHGTVEQLATTDLLLFPPPATAVIVEATTAVAEAIPSIVDDDDCDYESIVMNGMSVGELVDMAQAHFAPNKEQTQINNNEDNKDEDDANKENNEQNEQSQQESFVFDKDVEENCSLLTQIETEIEQLSLKDNSVEIESIANANTKRDRDYDNKNDNDHYRHEQKHAYKHSENIEEIELDQNHAGDSNDNAPPSHELISSSKEIANAMDLKENNAAAEITTQDLPGTSE